MSVSAMTDDGVDVQGWWIDASNSRAVLVCSGLGGNRTSSLGVAASYLRRGWSVLLPDLRGTGMSGGDRIAFGYFERLDVLAWVRLLRDKGMVDIGLHGHSLGGAAIAYALRDLQGPPAFVVLDSCYDDLRHALFNRLPWMPWPRVSLLPVEWFGSAVLGAGLDELRPAQRLPSVTCPVLIVAGDADDKVLPCEANALFEQCGSRRKQICWMPGGGHENLWNRFAQRYEAALDELLK